MLSRVCLCKTPERAAENPRCPVEFDEQMHEFHLVQDGAHFVMRHCYWCGGRLPASRRREFFTKPAWHEVAEVKEAMAGSRTLEQVVAVLGEPDERPVPSTVDPRTGEPVDLRQTLRYSRRWKTLVLDVSETAEGRVLISWHGQPRNEQSAAPPKRRWWELWK